MVATKQSVEAAVADALEKYGPALTEPEFRELAKVNPTTAWRWRRDGIGPHPTLAGRTYRYGTADTIRFLLEGTSEQ